MRRPAGLAALLVAAVPALAQEDYVELDVVGGPWVNLASFPVRPMVFTPSGSLWVVNQNDSTIERFFGTATPPAVLAPDRVSPVSWSPVRREARIFPAESRTIASFTDAFRTEIRASLARNAKRAGACATVRPMPRYFSDAELERLRELRSTFLSFEVRPALEHDPGGAYWDSDEELALYDETFARRIAWKWDAVLEELARRGRLAAGASVLDWGCGTGVAARAFLARVAGVERVFLFDHSPAATRFAAERVRAEHPGVEATAGLPDDPPDVLLVSHVLDELDEAALAPLLELAGRAGAVIWVEPGSRRTSRALGALRERLAATLDVLAPCTHQAACGALARNDSWCHFFARAPQAVYTEGQWAELGRELGIDLRSLPYAFLAFAQRGRFDLAGPSARMLARPRLTRGRAELEVCDASGVRSLDFLQRFDKALFKLLDDVAGEPWLFDMTVEGRRITALERRDRREGP